jgi:hypothetical protein
MSWLSNFVEDSSTYDLIVIIVSLAIIGACILGAFVY